MGNALFIVCMFQIMITVGLHNVELTGPAASKCPKT